VDNSVWIPLESTTGRAVIWQDARILVSAVNREPS